MSTRRRSDEIQIRTVIADDDMTGRARIRALLEGADDVEIVAEVRTGDDTLAAVRDTGAMLLFLDAGMPRTDGLAVLRTLRGERGPCTILTTTDASHAIDAYAFKAADCLLKPYSAARFAHALDHARGWIGRDPTRPRSLRRVVARDNRRLIVVPVEEIRLIEAAANFVVLHTASGRVMVRRTLCSLEADLDPACFMRVSRSAIVNLEAVRTIEWVCNGEHSVVLQGGLCTTLTRALRPLQEMLERGAVSGSL